MSDPVQRYAEESSVVDPAIDPIDDPSDELDGLLADLTSDPDYRGALEDASELYRLLDALRAVRKVQKLKQRDVAERMGTTQSAVSKLEGGASDPQITTLMRYARAINARIAMRPCVDGALGADSKHTSIEEWVDRPAGARARPRPSVRPATGPRPEYLRLLRDDAA